MRVNPVSFNSLKDYLFDKHLRIKDLNLFASTSNTFNMEFELSRHLFVSIKNWSGNFIEVSFRHSHEIDPPFESFSINNTDTHIFNKIIEISHFLELEINNHVYVNLLDGFFNSSREHILGFISKRKIPISIPIYGEELTSDTEYYRIGNNYFYKVGFSCHNENYLNIENIFNYELELLQFPRKGIKDFIRKIIKPENRSNMNYFNENYATEGI